MKLHMYKGIHWTIAYSSKSLETQILTRGNWLNNVIFTEYSAAVKGNEDIYSLGTDLARTQCCIVEL